jgi:insertion element IS1 protein InsB
VKNVAGTLWDHPLSSRLLGCLYASPQAAEHNPDKWHTQQIAREHLTLRTRIKRLTHKTIYLSRSSQMHDIVLGLLVTRFAFGLPV